MMVEQDLLTYDHQSAVRDMKDVFSFIIDAMVEIKPDISITAVAGAVAALNNFISSGYV